MRKFDLSLRSSRSSYFATFRHQLTILSKTDALDEEKWLNMLGTFVKDWFRYESHFVHRSEERFSRNAETDLVCRLLLEKKNRRRSGAVSRCRSPARRCSTDTSSYRGAAFFFNSTTPTDISTLSLHDALPISLRPFAIN